MACVCGVQLAGEALSFGVLLRGQTLGGVVTTLGELFSFRCIGMGSREVELFVCFDAVLRHAPTGGVHHAKVVQRVRVPLFRGFAVPR